MPDFVFETDAAKLKRFQRWLQDQIDQGILEIDRVTGEPKGIWPCSPCSGWGRRLRRGAGVITSRPVLWDERPIRPRLFLFRAVAAGQRLKQRPAGFNRVSFARLTQGNPFQQIHSSLPRFDSAYDIEGPIQPGSQIPLRELGVTTHQADDFRNSGLAGAI